MRKIYSLLLMLVVAVGLSFQANAAVTVKVNKTGVLYYKSFGDSGETTLNAEVNELPNDFSGMTVGEIHCPTGYTMTATITNSKVTDGSVSLSESGGEQYISVNPGTTPDGSVINITVAETGGGSEPVQQTISFVFVPAGSGYVVTTHYDDTYIMEDDTYTPDEDGVVEVPYSSTGYYRIKPNSGYALINAKDETDTNPHSNGDVPGSDGFINASMSMTHPGASIIVTASHNGKFTVRGVGDNTTSIQMQNLSTYDYVTVSTDETEVAFSGGVEYKIYSSAASPLWKVEVTDAEDYTSLLEGNYGNFMYTPTDGDKVVIYTDKPQMYCKFSLAYGDGVDSSVIKTVYYGSTEEEENTWKSGSWTKEAEDYLRIYFNTSKFTNISCTINGTPCTISTDSSGNSYIGYQANNGTETLKEYNIVINAEKPTIYTVTLNCETPSAISIGTTSGYTIESPFNFTQSGQTFQVSKTNNKLKIMAQNGWELDGILLNDTVPGPGEFTDGIFFVNADCTLTINVSNKADKRNMTAVVYVDESTANPMYLDFKYGDNSTVAIKPGYNFVPFCESDLPFSFGYFAGGDAVFYVNGSKISVPVSCPETIGLEDGAVIKYFNGTPTSQVVTYIVDEEVADMIDIFHDYKEAIDHQTTQEYACFTGTLIHIKPKDSTVKSVKRRANVETEPLLMVRVNNKAIWPDKEGVYTVKVGDTAPTITVANEQVPLGITDVNAAGDCDYTIVNMKGAVVKRNATAADVNALPAGIYIINNTKVIKK